jgi:ADP-ribose pyrophosphatase YjhB (NUDIX family)
MNEVRFNIRVYGLLINNQNEVLLSDEQEYGKRFTKFTGGGLEYGEGLIDGLKREFIEECNLEIDVIEHFYTTDFFIESIFGGGQLISVYYLVKPKSEIAFKLSIKVFDFDEQVSEPKQSFRFVAIADLIRESVTFPVDQHVVNLLKEKYS